MITTSAIKTFMVSNAGRATSLSIITLAGIAGATLLYFSITRSPSASGAAVVTTQIGVTDLLMTFDQPNINPEDGAKFLTIPKDKVQQIGLETVPVRCGDWPVHLRVTGRVELNDDRVAHVSPLVEGVVREVPVQLGQQVKRGDVLAYVDSREVGEAKLKLTKDQLQLTSARKISTWYRAIYENTSALLELLEKGQTVDEIKSTFQDRPVGTYRQQLVSAWARLKRAKADFNRTGELGENGVIPEKEVIRSRTEYEAAEATYWALMEQIRFDAQQQALDAQQKLQAAETAIAISRSHLLILGYSEEDIDSMDPIAEAERVAYYPVRSPITGTVLAKEVPLSKHVNNEAELFRIADLSTVWLRADLFEKDLDAAQGLQGKSVTFKTNSYPSRQFTADIFSLGDVIDDKTRAARLLAIADNSERLLKPGMFVEVEMTPHNDTDVLQLPASAIQRHAGTVFVFVFNGSEGFERRDVKLGRATSEIVEIVAGLTEDELVVTQGGFALKSEMLSELLVEE